MGAVDGPGMRFVVFMQGCPLRCAYCHNPDTWDYDGGTEYSADEIMSKITRYIPYIKNGGVTISGGEPLVQAEFVKQLFIKAHEINLHTAIDTSGIGNLDKVKELLEYTDLVLLDLKFTNAEDYKLYAKADFLRVIEFLNLCRQMDKQIWIRNVVVPTINYSAEHIEKLCSLLLPYNSIIQKLEFLPFRKLCTEKYHELGIEFPFENLPQGTEEDIKEFYEIVKKYGIKI